MSHLIIIRGLPGSGKSTLAKKYAREHGYAHFEADQFFINTSGAYVYDRTRIGDAHRWCRDRTFEALNGGQNVVVSNTFVRFGEYEPYVTGATIAGHTYEIVVCTGTWGSVHGVPVQTIERMKRNWEP